MYNIYIYVYLYIYTYTQYIYILYIYISLAISNLYIYMHIRHVFVVFSIPILDAPCQPKVVCSRGSIRTVSRKVDMVNMTQLERSQGYACLRYFMVNLRYLQQIYAY